AFLDGLGLDSCDVLGFSLGGMIAQQMAKDRPSIVRRMILVGTAPRGGEDIMHLEKPSLAKHLQDPRNTGYAVLQKIFFAPTSTSQASGEAFIARLMQRKDDRDPPSGPNVAKAQITAFREWERVAGERFADLRGLRYPTLVVQGFHDEMIPVRNSYWLAENLPNAALLAYPDAGHGSLFQYPESFTRHAAAFLSSDSDSAVFCGRTSFVSCSRLEVLDRGADRCQSLRSVQDRRHHYQPSRLRRDASHRPGHLGCAF